MVACRSMHTHTHTKSENRELIQSRVMLTATLLFLKGTLHKISSPHHLSSGIFVYLHNTRTHTHIHAHVRKHCIDTQKHSHTHTHAHTVGVNVPSPRICVSKQFKLVKKKKLKWRFFFLFECCWGRGTLFFFVWPRLHFYSVFWFISGFIYGLNYKSATTHWTEHTSAFYFIKSPGHS